MNHKKYNTTSFIKEASEKHNNFYSYENTKFVNSTTKVEIVCPTHGSFFQRPYPHIKGAGCQKCGRISTRLSLSEFLERANKKHPNKYDYSKITELNPAEKICIVCKEHGEFFQSVQNHLSGTGCPKCGRISRRKGVPSGTAKTTEQFILDARKVHGDTYNYSQATYKKSSESVKIICKIHGLFEQTANDHLMGNGCVKCSYEKRSKNSLKTQEDFIHQVKDVHGDLYDTTCVEYKGSSKTVTLVCKKHGEFNIIAADLLYGRGCPYCRSSRGELQIQSLLNTLKLPFKRQYKIKNCKDKVSLPFDFAVFEDQEKSRLKCLIEYDGSQHYIPGYVHDKDTDDFTNRQLHDVIKTQFCIKNNIKLLRIPFWRKNEIDSLLKDNL